MIAALRRWFGGPAVVVDSAIEDQSPMYRCLDDWRRDAAVVGARQSAQREAFLATATKTAEIFCGLCRRVVAMPLPWVATQAAPDLREALVCPSCHLNARARAALGLMQARHPSADAAIYVTEQASPAFVWLRQHYPNARGSEYAMAPARRQAIEGWLHQQGVPGAIALEDVTALSFADASLDAIGCFDVLEHVPDYHRALAEFARVLRPGGDLFLTVPFLDNTQQTLVRARINAAGNIEHLLPPEIHGDPLSDGVLCYYHFGWDLLDAARRAGFTDAAWRRTWAPEQGLFGLWTLHAEKGVRFT